MSKEVTLPSGAKLVINPAPFKDARALYQALLEEGKALKINGTDELDVNLFKDMFCASLSSKKIEMCLTKCMERSTYNGLKIVEDLFEPIEAREDYLPVCLDVTLENIKPFTKALMPLFSQAMAMIVKPPA